MVHIVANTCEVYSGDETAPFGSGQEVIYFVGASEGVNEEPCVVPLRLSAGTLGDVRAD